MIAWLRRSTLGLPRWAWLALLAVGGGTLVWTPVAALLVPWALAAIRPSRVLVPRQDPAQAAQETVQAHEEADRALSGVQAEARAQGEQAAQDEARAGQAARTDDADAVAARVAARGRR